MVFSFAKAIRTHIVHIFVHIGFRFGTNNTLILQPINMEEQ